MAIVEEFPEHAIEVVHQDFTAFLALRGVASKDGDARREYNAMQAQALKDCGIDTVALAGWDWVVTPDICDAYLTVNVHPGDLRRRGEDGRPLYRGLAWVPSAKAILHGDNEVYSVVHIVTAELDAGPLLALSAPQPVPKEVKALSLEERAKLLGHAASIKEISAFIREHRDIEKKKLSLVFPLYGYACDCQERLKIHGDWEIFPTTIERIARGEYARNDEETIHYNGAPVPHGVQFGGRA